MKRKMNIYFTYPTYGNGGVLSAEKRQIIAGSERQILVTKDEAMDAGFTENEINNLPDRAVIAGNERGKKLRRSAKNNVWL